MTIDKLIEELQLMKERGISGETEVYSFHDDDFYAYQRVSTVRIDGEGELILDGEKP